MAKYIKTLTLENNNNFESVDLNFKPGINLIIGPKGGGKSTLMEIINYFHKGAKFNKKQQKKFNEFNNLKINKMVYSDESVITLEQLSDKNEQIIQTNYISQDDNLKTNMHEQDSVLTKRDEFVEKIYAKYEEEFQGGFSSYLKSMQKILDLYNNLKSDFSMINKLENVENTTTKLITKFELNKTMVQNDFMDINQSIENQISSLKKVVANYHLLTKTLTKANYFDLDIKWNNDEITLLENKIKDLENAQEQLKQQNNYIQNFIKSLQIIKDQKANAESLVEKSTRFKEEMFIFVSAAAQLLVENKILFNNLYNNHKVVTINEEISLDSGLSFCIDTNLNIWSEINENDHLLPMAKILEAILYRPSKSDRDFFNWVEMLIVKNKMKKNNFLEAQKKLKTEIIKIISKHVVIKYENQNYENLSLGQRTSLMLENKLKNISPTQILFLDQPEDNIDNHTIANVLVKIVNKKKQNNELNQIFVVTHNANFGILLNPSTLTIATLNKDTSQGVEVWYQQFLTTNEIGTEINNFKQQQSYYLEGGNDILQKRYNKLVGGYDDN